MHLVIDIGNTLCKAAVFNKEDHIVALWSGTTVDAAAITKLIETHHPHAAIVSSVRNAVQSSKTTATVGAQGKGVDGTLAFLEKYGFPVVIAGPHLQLPVAISYKTPGTLGTDRLAAAVAVRHLFPEHNVVVIMAGTCLTTDGVTKDGEYLGGTIAPGLQMRLRALHHFTGNLPLVDYPGHQYLANNDVPGADAVNKPLVTVSGQTTEEPTYPPSDHPPLQVPMPGQSTGEAILSGVINGMIAEMNGLTDMWREKIRIFNVILSGGDRKIFDKKLKNRIFAVANIVLHGLNQMLKHNV